MIGKTNAGGSNVGGKLTVKAPANVTVKAVKGSTTRSQTSGSGGSAVFRGLSQGSWNISISNSEQTVTIPITITTDYSMTIAFFAAKITVTYPSGSTCTCTNGSTTYTASNTNGSWTFTVPMTGTWTVKCTSGSNSASSNVSITANGQSASVTLSYWDGTLYYQSNQYTDHTGGWGNKSYYNNEVRGMDFYTNKKIDVSKYSKLTITTKGLSNVWTTGFGLSTIGAGHVELDPDMYRPYVNSGSFTACVYNNVVSNGTTVLDISSVNGSFYVVFSICGQQSSYSFDNIASIKLT